MDASRIFSFDAETNGLWGKPFSIAALVLDEAGAEVARFVGRCPIEGEIDDWVVDNVLPQLEDVPVSHESYPQLLEAFAAFYMQWKQGADVIFHMAIPVESSIVRDMHDMGFIGDWDAPYPPIDLVGVLRVLREDPTSVDSYLKKYGLSVGDYATTHHPLYDSEVAAVVYRHAMGWE